MTEKERSTPVPGDLLSDFVGTAASGATFLVGSDGKVLEVIRTWRPGRHAEDALDRLTAERPPPEASAPSRGSERP